MLMRESTRGRKRPFHQEVAEMVRHAVGYHTRAFVTIGQPIPLSEYDPESRRDLVSLMHRIQRDIGLLYKVLPTALVAAAMRPHLTRGELVSRIDDILAVLSAEGANLSVRSGRQAVDDGVDRLAERGVLVTERHRIRVRDRMTLRYYSNTLQHLLAPKRRTAH